MNMKLNKNKYSKVTLYPMIASIDLEAHAKTDVLHGSYLSKNTFKKTAAGL